MPATGNRKLRRGAALLAVPALLMIGAAIPATIAHAAGSYQGCSVTTSGSTVTLTADCTINASIELPAGVTFDGGGHTITATDPGGADPDFTGGAIEATSGAVTITNVTIKGGTLGTHGCHTGDQRITGVYLKNASGVVSHVTVNGLTEHSGCQEGFSIKAGSTSAQTLSITDSTFTDYGKGGVVVSTLAGQTTSDVALTMTGSTIGPEDPATLSATNAVQVSYGNTADIHDNTIIGDGYANPSTQATGVLLYQSGATDVWHNTIRFDGSGTSDDIGVYVLAGSTDTTVVANHITHTPPAPGTGSYGVYVDPTGTSADVACNTFTGWDTDSDPTQSACTFVVTPATKTVTAGTSVQYKAVLSFGSSTLGVTSGTTWTMTKGTCTAAGACTSTVAGTHPVTGTLTGTAFSGVVHMTVTAGPLAKLDITGPTSVTVGDTGTYTATGYDKYGNSLGDVTSSTTFSVGSAGTCTGNVCTFTTAGTGQVHATDGTTGATGVLGLTIESAAAASGSPLPDTGSGAGAGGTARLALVFLGLGLLALTAAKRRYQATHRR
jgi:hypothetical protein